MIIAHLIKHQSIICNKKVSMIAFVLCALLFAFNTHANPEETSGKQASDIVGGGIAGFIFGYPSGLIPPLTAFTAPAVLLATTLRKNDPRGAILLGYATGWTLGFGTLVVIIYKGAKYMIRRNAG